MSKVTFTLTEFRKHYNTDAACLDKIFQLRYGKLEACPECQCVAKWRRITTRRCYQCTSCYAQFYPTAGTPFEKTRTPLADWFYIIYLFTTTRNGVAAKEIERQLGVTYKCAFRMGHCIRALIGGMDTEILKGFVEFDESYSGGAFKNKSKQKRKEIRDNQERYIDRKGIERIRNRNTDGKASVFAMVERGGKVIAYTVPKITKATVFTLATKHIDKNAIVSTDESRLYDDLGSIGFEHGRVLHAVEQYRNGMFCTNTIEGYFSQLKRTIKGTHLHVSEEYLQNYINECSFRYNNRKTPNQMFDAIIGNFKPVTI